VTVVEARHGEKNNPIMLKKIRREEEHRREQREHNTD